MHSRLPAYAQHYSQSEKRCVKRLFRYRRNAVAGSVLGEGSREPWVIPSVLERRPLLLPPLPPRKPEHGVDRSACGSRPRPEGARKISSQTCPSPGWLPSPLTTPQMAGDRPHLSPDTAPQSITGEGLTWRRLRRLVQRCGEGDGGVWTRTPLRLLAGPHRILQPISAGL